MIILKGARGRVPFPIIWPTPVFEQKVYKEIAKERQLLFFEQVSHVFFIFNMIKKNNKEILSLHSRRDEKHICFERIKC